MRTLSLDTIKKGLATLSPAFGGFLAEACMVSLNSHGHTSGVTLEALDNSLMNVECKIEWSDIVDERVSLSWQDPEEATEFGAMCLGVLLVINFTECKTVTRSMKGTGMDFWVGSADEETGLPFNKKARLEISGIKEGTDKIKARMKTKTKQILQSANSGLPGYIAIIEFSKPIANFVKNG